MIPDALTLFGVAALSVMLICYALERKSSWYTLGMALACVAAAAYGFLEGTWPFGVLEMVWGAIAFVRWWRDFKQLGSSPAVQGRTTRQCPAGKASASRSRSI